jgi:hypothetical protein
MKLGSTGALMGADGHGVGTAQRAGVRKSNARSRLSIQGGRAAASRPRAPNSFGQLQHSHMARCGS